MDATFRIEHFDFRVPPRVEGQPESDRPNFWTESRVRMVDPSGREFWCAIGDILRHMPSSGEVDPPDPEWDAIHIPIE